MYVPTCVSYTILARNVMANYGFPLSLRILQNPALQVASCRLRFTKGWGGRCIDCLAVGGRPLFSALVSPLQLLR